MWKQQQSSLTWTESNIIVKNLPPSTDSQILHQVFSRYGKIISSKVKTTAQGRCLSYGYVQFESKESAARAITDVCSFGVYFYRNIIISKYFFSVATIFFLIFVPFYGKQIKWKKNNAKIKNKNNKIKIKITK
ncbi:translation initiation factor [Reticulomyxa filosa]|uniref:Translation initiation factor n=1 Tax=Reticulomyxa filosa TaxID=46433 RepID=X6NP83_RETFI|nr:translation initiation factor [Reticulomyxa filosa]|eukprot:ETO28090.1 translation initiation factor [Reticulomyxa filosa]